MSRNGIAERIDALFSATNDPEEIRVFFEAIRSTHEHAARAFTREALSFLAAWALFYGIGADLIQEGDVNSFKFANIKTILIAAPVLLGGLTYLMATAMGTAEFTLNALRQSYKHRLPKAFELDLEELVAVPTIINVERYLESEVEGAFRKKLVTGWWAAIGGALVLGTLFAIIHVSLLLVKSDIFTAMSNVAVIAAGVLLWLRGMYLLYTYVEIS